MGPAGLETANGVTATRLRLHSAEIPAESSGFAATGEELTALVRSQLKKSRDAQAAWSETTMRDRAGILKKLRLRIAGDPVTLAKTVDRANLSETLAAEVLPLLDACRFLESEAARILQEKNVGTRGRPMWLWGNSIALRPEPLGVVLIIAPSNYPLMLPGIQALQAIAAGNSVLIKPAANCSQTMLALAAMLQAAGTPEGLIQILPESPEAAAVAIQCDVDKVFLTGSATTGQAVSQELAASTTPSVMELSGCDAVFVLDDADVNLVTDCLLFGLTLNNSQTCMAPRRVFASDEKTDAILRLLKRKLEARNASQQESQQHVAQVGAVFAQSRSLKLAASTIREAIADGAELVYGSLLNGHSAELSGAVVLDHVTPEMAVAQSDLFAPVLSFIRTVCDTEALQQNAKCPYALSATVFGSPSRSQQFARRIHAGCVVINDMIVPTADPRVPFGGRGMSGHGTTRGEAGLLEMTQLKAIVTTRRWFKPHLQSPTSADAQVLEQLIRLEHSASPLQSLWAVPKMIKATIEQMKIRRSQRRTLTRPGTGNLHSIEGRHSRAGGNPDRGDGFPPARE